MKARKHIAGVFRPRTTGQFEIAACMVAREPLLTNTRQIMPQSLHCTYGHLIFSTKNREPMITGEIESRLYEYLGGIVRNLKASLIEINGMPDHVHLLIRESKSIADQDFMGQLKGDSSRWMNATFTDRPRFSWQAGYGWFSVNPPDVEVAAGYIQGQKDHHRKTTFQDEYRKFLRTYRVEFDERYVWD